nr:embryogenesis-associated protein emb8 [Quercus suber]
MLTVFILLSSAYYLQLTIFSLLFSLLSSTYSSAYYAQDAAVRICFPDSEDIPFALLTTLAPSSTTPSFPSAAFSVAGIVRRHGYLALMYRLFSSISMGGLLFLATEAKHGWNVVISNHRGLGGVSITSDCFYNAGWTEDVRVVINHLHKEYPKAPLFAVGTSIGANILVSYLNVL